MPFVRDIEWMYDKIENCGLLFAEWNFEPFFLMSPDFCGEQHSAVFSVKWFFMDYLSSPSTNVSQSNLASLINFVFKLSQVFHFLFFFVAHVVVSVGKNCTIGWIIKQILSLTVTIFFYYTFCSALCRLHKSSSQWQASKCDNSRIRHPWEIDIESQLLTYKLFPSFNFKFPPKSPSNHKMHFRAKFTIYNFYASFLSLAFRLSSSSSCVQFARGRRVFGLWRTKSEIQVIYWLDTACT